MQFRSQNQITREQVGSTSSQMGNTIRKIHLRQLKPHDWNRLHSFMPQRLLRRVILERSFAWQKGSFTFLDYSCLRPCWCFHHMALMIGVWILGHFRVQLLTTCFTYTQYHWKSLELLWYRDFHRLHWLIVVSGLIGSMKAIISLLLIFTCERTIVYSIVQIQHDWNTKWLHSSMLL